MISVRICSPDAVCGPQWDDLAQRAAANVFMNPAALRAAQASGFADIRVLLATDDSAPDRLVGLWALQRRKLRAWWPATLQGLPHGYACLSNPVVDPTARDAVMRAFIAALAGDDSLPDVVDVSSFNVETADFAALRQALAAAGGRQLVLVGEGRPVVTREFGVKRSGSTRKKLRQDWNRLAALGAVDIRNDRAAAAVVEAFETFLALEAASWKGDRGTALLCSERDVDFARRMVAALAAQGAASVALLCVDGRAIAAQVLMYCGRTAYTWKIGFDAAYARFSPGALLVDKITEELFAGTEIDTIDSCSAESGFMGALWAGRVAMADLLIGVRPKASLAFRLEALRLQGYHGLRRLRDRLRARRAVQGAGKPAVQERPPVPLPRGR